MSENAAWLARYRAALLPVFAPPAVLARGEGPYVWDVDGRRYLDLLAGIAVNALGHAHPVYLQRLAAQFAELGHVSNLFASPPQIELAEKLLALAHASGDARVFFANSGTEAVEAAVKAALRTGRPRLLAFDGAFHGRTLGALAVTAKEAYRKPFEPLPGGVEFLPFGDLPALETAIGDDVAAIVLEIIQGEGGVRPLPPAYLARARRLADAHGALLIVDEVQTGMGRTGTWFAHRHPALVEGDVTPDIVTLAKGLGAGFPIGAMLALTGKAAALLGPGDHGTTFGGNPPAAAAALAAIQIIERDGLLANAVEVGAGLSREITASGHPLIAGVRGAGLLLAVEFAAPVAKAVADAALAAGFITGAVTETALRLAPPLILAPEEAATFTAALPGLLDAVTKDPKP